MYRSLAETSQEFFRSCNRRIQRHLEAERPGRCLTESRRGRGKPILRGHHPLTIPSSAAPLTCATISVMAIVWAIAEGLGGSRPVPQVTSARVATFHSILPWNVTVKGQISLRRGLVQWAAAGMSTFQLAAASESALSDGRQMSVSRE